jgi:hypothetical protein
MIDPPRLHFENKKPIRCQTKKGQVNEKVRGGFKGGKPQRFRKLFENRPATAINIRLPDT